MIKNILILEDKEIQIEALVKILSGLERKPQIFTAQDSEKAYQISMKRRIHLFLVDIILDASNPGDVSGLQFVRELRNVRKYEFTPVIFITSLEDPRLLSYRQLHCFSYLEKPFCDAHVRAEVEKALKFPVQEERERFIYFRKDGIVYSKNADEIVYIEASRRKLKVYCVNDVLEVPYKTCGDILAELDCSLFARCSRSGIVNKRHIDTIDYVNRSIRMRHLKRPVEIGTTMKKLFREQMEPGR